MTTSSVGSLSIISSAADVDYVLELIKAFGPGVLPFAAAALYTVAVNNQVGIIERTTRAEIASSKETVDNQIKALHETTDIQIKALHETTDIQIKAINNQIKALHETTDIQIKASNKISEEMIKASEARIDSILMKFVVQNNSRVDDKKS